MNPMALMKLMSAKNKFNANHPKVGAFFKAAFGSGLQEGTILELTVTKPDGEKMTTNLKVKPSDLELLNELRCEQGTALSILFICHDISLVQQFCDRVLVMNQGRMIEEGTPDEVIRAPRQEYTKRLIESIL